MFPRYLAYRISQALLDTRVVLLAGPRQAGKTTLARNLDNDRAYFTLDDAATREAALADPTGFVRGLDRATIDEVQRAPQLLLAIKDIVDRDGRRGRFLLTGSANLMTLPTVADSLAGRMETLQLLPLSQAEMRSERPPPLFERAFNGHAPIAAKPLTGADLVEAVLAGGYPEAVQRDSGVRRRDWAVNYVDALVQRDVRDISSINRLDQMPRLLNSLAHHSAQLTNYNALGAELGLNHVTTRSYAAIFEQLFLIRTLPAWHGNALKRLLKTPKVHFLDTGLLAAIRGLSPEALERDRVAFGPILESFVVSEVFKIASWSDRRLTFSHFRDKDGAEVDLVIEDSAGAVVGIEVKASASVSGSDFSGLRKLKQAVGDRFAQGLVLYDHDRIVPFGDRLWAAPISALWA